VNFIVQVLRGHDITIYGDGMQSRAFCYVDDMIDGLVRLMKSPDDVTGPLNLGNPEEITMRELAALTIQQTGSRSKIVHRPLPQDDPRQHRPDISRANTLLGWGPRTPLLQGLARTISYFDQLLAEPDARDVSALSSQPAI
jgi:UDP-glucuronate decarboxylase